MKNITLLTITFVIAATQSFAASENLDELAARKERFATATWDKTFLEDPSTLVWQPETLTYTDVETGAEVWRLSNTKEKMNSLPDISWAHWSADGKRFSFGSHRDTSANDSSYEYSDNYTYQGAVMMMRADGSYLRPADNGPFEVYINSRYLHWSPVEPDVYYGFGNPLTGATGPVKGALYRTVVGDTSITKEIVLDMNLGGVPGLKKSMSHDGTKMVAYYDGLYYPITLLPTVSVDDATGWEMSRQLDPYWGNTPVDTNYSRHDNFLVGVGDNIKMYFIPEGLASWWRMALSGTGVDGGPEHISDQVAPYSWGGVEPVLTGFSSGGDCGTYKSPWNCDDDPLTGPEQYLSHPSFSRGGRYIAGINSQQYQAMGVWDLDNHQWKSQRIPTAHYDWHTDWSAWSDYFAASPSGSFTTSDNIYVHHLDGTDSISVASTHPREAGSLAYNSLPRVTQSPDGTKAVFHSDFLYKTANTWDVFYAVAYYPHPPEVTSVTNNSGTYTVRFDWRTDQPVSRGYTQRGWPDEATDDPSPPRETKLFRLWRSANGTDGWVPVGTVNADIFSRYNFATGDWTGNNYWEISDTPGSGTWYYAVTAQEHSGLESRTLSNVFSTAGAQTAAYPSDPKGDSDFATVYNPTTVRHYNIYAADGTAPTATQQDRIASIPVAAAGEYVDWLGDAAGTTQYLVTAVDTQGNESGAIDGVTRTVLATPGQYKLQWGQATPRRLSLAGRPIKLAEPGP